MLIKHLLRQKFTEVVENAILNGIDNFLNKEKFDLTLKQKLKLKNEILISLGEQTETIFEVIKIGLFNAK